MSDLDLRCSPAGLKRPASSSDAAAALPDATGQDATFKPGDAGGMTGDPGDDGDIVQTAKRLRHESAAAAAGVNSGTCSSNPELLQHQHQHQHPTTHDRSHMRQQHKSRDVSDDDDCTEVLLSHHQHEQQEEQQGKSRLKHRKDKHGKQVGSCHCPVIAPACCGLMS